MILKHRFNPFRVKAPRELKILDFGGQNINFFKIQLKLKMEIFSKIPIEILN